MKKRGFTLIELLVVIAIIGILAAVVLASLNLARRKGVDAAIEGDFNSARNTAGLFYDANNGMYVQNQGDSTDVCNQATDANTQKGMYDYLLAAAQKEQIGVVYNAVGDANNVVCNSTASPDGWAAQAPLTANTNTFYCIDSTGSAGVVTGNQLTAADDISCTN